MANEKLLYLINYLLLERSGMENVEIPDEETEQFRFYRSLVNIRSAILADEKFLRAEDEFLAELTASKGITDIADLQPVENGIYLWKGDITTLKCGAIVNAANSGMTGCWQPCHSCIDNCIHTFSGVRLRYKCTQIMQTQRHEEPTVSAKITPAYNLPCDYVIHTVGPIVQGRLTHEHCGLLESCYKSCLDDFIQKYGFSDMYSGGFYPFESPEEHWAYWSRYIYINRYMDVDNGTYQGLLMAIWVTYRTNQSYTEMK